ncbi:MAG: argininosuccinate lyase [Rikenellaceae bacterium]
MKLWQKSISVDKRVELFTVGRDREMDMMLARADVLGSLAHTKMLNSINLLSDHDLELVQTGLKAIYQMIENGEFEIDPSMEDVHSAVEFMLVEMIGEAGKRIHSGRSRNDQVLVDLKLYLRRELHNISNGVESLFNELIALSEKHKDILMPGYTHLQIAMPSSFGLWFSAYAESLVDDMENLSSTFKICNKNPLGSAAGYGSSFPLNRTMTTELLGFDNLNYNVVYAQMGRGKCERLVAQTIGNIASTLSRLAMDNCMFSNQNFDFISYPTQYTTGSSIMPHKKNPDVWELLRGKCNILQTLPQQIVTMMTNLPLGYNRDMQLIKELLFPAIEQILDCLDMAKEMLSHIEIKDGILEDKKYDYLFSVESVNNLTLSGVPFREAYLSVGLEIERGEYTPERKVNHSHEGSIGNLCNDKICDMMNHIIKSIDFEHIEKAEKKLLDNNK